MKKLFILRHGYAQNARLKSPDRERELTQEGQKVLQARSAEFKKNLANLDVIFCSPATRTQQTANIVLKAIANNMLNIQNQAFIYECDAQDLLFFLQELDNQYNQVMIVGHNPTLSQFATQFYHRPIHLEPGDLLSLTFDIETWQDLTFSCKLR